MKLAITFSLILSLTVISFSGKSQCSVNILPQGATSFCEGDSVTLVASGSGNSLVLDQQQTVYNGGTSARTLPGYSYWQSFTAGVTGTLASIEMGFFNYINGTGYFTVFKGSGTTGQLLDSLTINVVCPFNKDTMFPFPLNIPVTAGSVYTFQIRAGPGMPDPYGLKVNTAGGYGGGQMAFVDPSGTSYPGFDMVFKTYVKGNLFYHWSDGATDTAITVKTGGMYSVTVTDSVACSGSDSLLVTVHPTPQPNLGNDTTICYGCSIYLYADSGFVSYLWNTGATTSTIFTDTSGSFIVQVTDSNGCTGHVTITVTILPFDFVEPSLIDHNQISISYMHDVIIIRHGNSNSERLSIRLYDIGGRIITDNSFDGADMESEIDLSELRKGVYLLRISFGNNLLAKKIMR